MMALAVFSSTLLLYISMFCIQDVTGMYNDCYKKPDVGSCEGYFPLWFYNKKRDMCQTFIYGGCGGNNNKFKTEEECIKGCKCAFKPKTGPCKGKKKRWYFDNKSYRCEQFIYGGCDAKPNSNPNNFESSEECREYCNPCELKKDPGPCRAIIPKWFYNAVKGKCEEFDYGGCKGNANRFDTRRMCAKSCKACNLEKDPGPCKANMKRYYYDYQRNKCKKFIYGGCEGNKNNFEEKKKCEKACVKKKP